jgi:hypothetical protein
MPCCSCATALAAEIQDNGVFKVIFGEKVKIYLMCSAQYWYDRKNDMINYNETKYLSELNGLAYPIVPLKFDVAQRAFNIDTDLYDTKLANAKEDISSKKDEDIDITSIFDDEDE